MKYKIVIPKNFLWSQTPAWWGPVFLGSNDIIPAFPQFVKQLRGFHQKELELVSVIGGMRFLDFLAELDFAKVTLFDRNINEISKFILAAEYICKTPYKEFDGFKELEEKIVKEPAEFYLPKPLLGKADIQPMQARIQNKRTNALTLLNSKDFPQYRWQPTQQQYKKVQGVLEKINFALHLDLPDIEAERRIVVAFLSHCGIPKTVVRQQIKNAAMVLPVDAYPKTPKLKGNPPRQEALFDGHRYWLHRVKQNVKGTSLHIWPPEAKKMAGKVFDKPFTKGIPAGLLVRDSFKEKFDTVIFHIFFGKSRIKMIDRAILFQRCLKKTQTLCNRVIITEYNRNGMKDPPSPVPTLDELNGYMEEVLQPSFSITKRTFYAGEGHAQRGHVIVIDNTSAG